MRDDTTIYANMYVCMYASPVFTSTGCVFSGFHPVSVDDVVVAVRAMPNKHSASDPIPIWLLKECMSELGPFLCRLFNASLISDHG